MQQVRGEIHSYNGRDSKKYLCNESEGVLPMHLPGQPALFAPIPHVLRAATRKEYPPYSSCKYSK